MRRVRSVKSYRKHMHEYAEMTALEVWYSLLNLDLFIRKRENTRSEEALEKAAKPWPRTIRRDTNSPKLHP